MVLYEGFIAKRVGRVLLQSFTHDDGTPGVFHHGLRVLHPGVARDLVTLSSP